MTTPIAVNKDDLFDSSYCINLSVLELMKQYDKKYSMAPAWRFHVQTSLSNIMDKNEIPEVKGLHRVLCILGDLLSTAVVEYSVVSTKTIYLARTYLERKVIKTVLYINAMPVVTNNLPAYKREYDSMVGFRRVLAGESVFVSRLGY
jgi:hypothetical protein